MRGESLGSKEEFRKNYRQIRSGCCLSPQSLCDLGDYLHGIVAEELLPNLSKKILVASYKAFASEVSLESWSHPQVEFCYPRVCGSEIKLFQVKNSGNGESDSSLFEENSFGILEPKEDKNFLVDIIDCQAVLVPGLAFHRSGHRLGYGAGFYDKFLSKYQGLKVGIGFSDQVTSQLWEVRPQDVLMDYIVTEKYTLKIQVGT